MRYVKRINKVHKIPKYSITSVIIFINVIVFLFINIIFIILSLKFENNFFNKFLSFVALTPNLFFQGYIWTLFTSMFTHIGFGHLLVNMISLFFIGSFIERIVGRIRYIRFYLISGLIAGLFFVGFAYLGTFFNNLQGIFGRIDLPGVGASGAIFGLGGLLTVLLPRLRVLLFFIIPMPMWAAMFFLMFGIWVLSAIGNLPVGNSAHFGGLLVGLIYGLFLRIKYSRKVKMLNKMFR